ncbi:hypothetical protein, partial [Alistipes ihumii]
MRSILKIALLLMVTIPVSCKRFANPFAGGDKVLAEVGGEKLYVHDLSSIFTPDMAPEDSVKILGSYVDRWVKMQLKIQEAERMFESSQQDIDRMVEEYRNSLLTHKVDQYYVDKLIDTLFTDSQIGEYYRKNQADFVLDKTLLKARVVRLPRSYGPKNKIKELMMASGEDRYQDLVDLCVKNNFELTELNGWTDFSTLLSLLPTDRTENYDDLLTTDRVSEMETSSDVYYVRILVFRRPGDRAPQESVQDLIRRVIFNQRKEEIVRAHEDSLYRHAMENKEI